MNVKPNDLAELQQALNSFKIEREIIFKEATKPYLFSIFQPAAALCVRRFLQKADRLFLELTIIVDTLKSEKNG